MGIEKLYELRTLLNTIISEEEEKIRNQPFQSEVGKSFQQRLHEKMEKKYDEANELRERLKIEDVL